MGWGMEDEVSGEVAFHTANEVVILCVRSFSAKVDERETHDLERGLITK